MSFILDALKKSEAERLRKDAPGIASIPEGGRQKSSTKWIWLVLALITVNLVVLAVLMMKVEQEPTSAEVPVAVTSTEARPAPAVTPSAAISVTQQDEALIANVESEAAVDEPVVTPVVMPTSAIEIMTNPQSGTVDSGLETFNDLRAKGVLVLPDMHLDIHVYSGDAADRFVFVNMSKYKENATLSEGPVVTEITPDGVILSYQGTAFLLPRE
jgi:general secretion pathway protein B